MSTQPIAAYSFLPWARQGLGIFIREGDQQAGVSERGSIDVSLQITGERLAGGTATEAIPKAVQLYGPGDIIGIDGKMIVRTEPRHWITNFETNYLPFIEFYDEDFPWRYTPNRPSPDGKRLRPWIMLVVLEESEFTDGSNSLGRPLPCIEVNDAAQKFPPFDQLWFWAHVHVNGGFGVDPNDTAALAARLDDIVTTNRDLAYSRLLCPRILKAHTAYHAFVIPTFETGRLAGLSKDPAKAASATQSAWADYVGKEEGTFFPYYHRWYFLTSSVGDFEYLVRLLQPRTVDPRVGRRDMDVQKPDANLPGIPELGGVLRLGGALRAPLETLSEDDLKEYERFEAWGKPYPHAFQTALAKLVNLAMEYGDHSATEANHNSGLGPNVEDDEDPLIVPPIYGRWHSQTSRLVPLEGDPAGNRWVQELNLDPRHRVAAGFGTQVVQQNQEAYMEAAWQQVGKVLEGNQKIRYGQMAKLVSQVWHARELSRFYARAPEQFLTITAPVQRRLLADGITIRHQISRSTVPTVALSKTMRQALRPRARVARLAGFNQDRTPAQLLSRVNRSEVSAAPPKVVASQLPTGKNLSSQFQPDDIAPDWLDLLDHYPWLRWLPPAAALLVVLLLIASGAGVAMVLLVGAGLAAAAWWLMRWVDSIVRRADAADAIDSETRRPASVDRLPTSSDFRIGKPGTGPVPTFGGTDSRESLRFKASLRNLCTVDQVERALPIEVRRAIDLPTMAMVAVQALDPVRTIPMRVLGSIAIPTRIVDQLREPFGEVMVYPEIDLPMYEPLKDSSSESFLPNLQLIQNNSITLLETNQKFIESYMVGLNHEFARELLWREYPTDQRGSYFRQFWDVRGFLTGPGIDAEARRERLYDIPELHRWATNSALGDHDHREEQGDKEDELVLVIRGELLKKYPTAVIYAHRAMWERIGDNRIDKSRPRKLAPLNPGQDTNPPRDLVKTPLYEAKVDPDIYLFGFDLTAEKARGGQIVNSEEDPGWFFVIKERPSEPRFGLDVPQSAPQATIHTWNDLAWTDVLNSYEPGKFLRIGEKTVSVTNPGAASEAKEQYDEDSRFQWRPDTHAAELAYILFQVPVLMAVHAAEMLKNLREPIMTDFEQIQETLSGKRRELDDQRRAALMAGELVKQLERTLAELARREGPRQSDERARIEKELKNARAQAERAGLVLSDSRATERGLLTEFTRFTDPRETLRLLPDHYPILLFPLRLETRFKTGAAGQPQLWVRVYPDTCLIDSFEDTLSEQEVANVRLFWAAVWRAGGDEVLERAAWRELVASHGSGRSSWILRQYQPINPQDKPVKDNPVDILLIISAGGPMPVAGVAYWQSVWRADGQADLLAEAYATLEAAVGVAQAREIADNFRPVNLADAPLPPHTRVDVQVKVALLQLREPRAEPTRRTSWSSAPRISLLPERFVLIGTTQEGASRVEIGSPIRNPLIAGPDPNASPDQQLKPVGDQLQIPDELAWMFDFEKALEAGMAFRFDLTTQQAASGFERLVVVGVRLADQPQQGRQNLETLLAHHLHSRAGLEILPQGRPTNNTEQGGSGYSFRDDAEATFDIFFHRTPQYTNEADPLARRDGQWLADLLGLSPDLVQQLPHAGGRDQSEARAMQIALWPGTLGYMMRTLLSPVFSDEEIASTRSFFTRYVSGRGPLPALRIGTQPYGLLLTTAFERINWFGREGRGTYLGKLHGILTRIETDWKQLLPRLSYIGKRGGDPHQILLDVLGLHPTSVEYYPLQAESLDQKFYELLFLDQSIAFGLLNLFPSAIPLTLLRSFGYVGAEVPDLLNKIFKARQTPLTGPLIDDRPLSEQDPIRNYADTRNYVEWLIDAAQAGIEHIQQEQGFDDGKKPAALLYLMLRHALQHSFYETGVRLQVEAGLIENPEASYREPAFVHVREPDISESRYGVLFRPAKLVTGRDGLLLGDYIARGLRTLHPNLREHIEALERLSPVPTARLERIFAEHIDTVTYRLDAWKTGLLAWQLESMRQQKDQGGSDGKPSDDIPGLFLGAYGWLEPVRPKQTSLTQAQLPPDLAEQVNKRDQAPLMRDSSNEGLIHAPSLNHATTAAVLRNGYLANEGRLAVNLSSRRVRVALSILEGMRNGQSMGALLGYQLERHIHDHGPLQVRALLYHLRRAFPLVANQIEKTSTNEGEAKESIAAMNVVDGRKLLEHAERVNNFTYPFAVATLPRRDAAQEAAMTNALASIRDTNDAVADLVLAEGVHQAVLGNYDRSAGTLDAFAKGNYPPEPDIVRTPRSGIALTLRSAIHLSPDPPANPLPAIMLTPLARAEPALNAWLKQRLPPPGDVGCEVTFTDRSTNAELTEFISQAQLGLHPIDLIYRIDAQVDQAVNVLDDCILDYIHHHQAPRFDRPILVRYTTRRSGKISWFELQALLNSLRPLVVGSRPLQPADLVRQNDVSRDDQATVVLPKNVVQTARDMLHTVHSPALDALITALDNQATTIDATLAQFAAVMGGLASYRLPQTGVGFLYEWRAGIYSNLTRKIDERVKQWDDRLARYLARINEYDNLPASTPEPERFTLLQAAEILISTKLTVPPPPSSGDYRLTLDGRQAAFESKRADLLQFVTIPRATFAELLGDIRAALPLTAFDPEPIDVTDEEAEVARFRSNLKQAALLVKGDLVKRIADGDALLLQHDSASALDRVKFLQQAVKLFFGEDFQLIPRFTLPASAADELANAWQHSTSGGLTKFLRDPKPAGAGRDFPLDDWLHGVARVREKMKQWETVVLLDDAFPGAEPPELTPLQLPHGHNEPWLALEIPVDYKIDSDRLLYTAHFADPFEKTKPICGLLVDEWTEVIPGTEETTGIAFHFDRPNAEPPQAWLLALPAVRDGLWSWEDLLGAVNHALDAAKVRAIEPAHVDTTAYSWFLPATTSAYTFPEISISNNLLRNLDIFAKFAKE